MIESKQKILIVDTTLSIGGSRESLSIFMESQSKFQIFLVCFDLDTISYYKSKNLNLEKIIYINDAYISKVKKNIIQRSLIKLSKILIYFFNSYSLIIINLIHRKSIRVIDKIISSNNIKCIYANISIYNELFIYHLALKKNLRLVNHLRTTYKSKMQPYINNKTYKVLNEKNFKYIAVSNFVKKNWLNTGIEPNKISVVYNAIKHDSKEKINSDLLRYIREIKSSSFTLGVVSRLVDWKRIEKTLDAFKLFKMQVQKSKLIIIGEGPMKMKLRDRINTLEIENDVFFLGKVIDASRYMSLFDVIVSSSLEEPFGRILVESMHARTPIVAHNSGAAQEIIDNMENGFLFNDIPDLVKILKYIFYNPNESKSIAENGKTKVKNKFSPEKYVISVEKELINHFSHS